jgi:hypothetical protein
MNDNDKIIADIKIRWKGKLFCCPFATCGAGLSNNNTNISILPTDASLVECRCPKCSKIWFLCRRCNDLGKTLHPLLSVEAVNNHNYRLHRHCSNKNINKRRRKEAVEVVHNEPMQSDCNLTINKVTPTVVSLETNPTLDIDKYRSEESISEDEEMRCDGADDDDEDSDDSECLQEIPKENATTQDEYKSNCNFECFSDNKVLIENVIFYQLNKKMSSFYSSNNINNDSGLKYLVSKSFTCSESIITDLSSEEAEFQFLLSEFVRNLTRPHQKVFANILLAMNNLYINPTTARQHPLCCEFPTTYNDLCRHYTSGVYSMSMNLPRPESTMLTIHSYLHLHECIADVLLQGKISLTTTHNFSMYQQQKDNVFNTKMANSIINEALVRYRHEALPVSIPLITIFLMLWSDDFEPNKGTKVNRQSVWSATATLFLMNNEGVAEFVTYPIAFGSKGKDHNEVHAQILDDITSLRSGKYTIMYSTYLKTPVCIHADIFAVLNDHPERRSTLKLAAGNSYYHTQFGRSCPFKILKEFILPCTSCKQQNLPLQTNCYNCSNWLLYENLPLLRFSSCNDFPTDKLGDENKLSVYSLSFTDLISSVKYVHEEVVNNNMSKNAAVAYLKYKCINTVSIEQIYECAYNCRLLELVEKNNDDIDVNLFNDLMEDKLDNPEKYTMWEIPSNWKYFDSFERFVEVPMHLFFLNCQKTLVMDVHSWLKFQKKLTYFQTKTKGLLEEIQKLQLSWLKLLPYPDGKGAGWVSENWMGLCRICMWLYQILEILPNPPAYSDPSTNPSTWTKKETTAWMTARGLQVGKQKAQELKAIVKSYFDSETIPEIIPVKGCSVSTVLKMIKDYYNIVVIGMDQHSIHNGFRMERAVCVFLTTYSEFADSISDDSKEPLYFGRYSLMSLLNLPNQLKNYSSMRFLWEGGMCGEGFLRIAKPEIKRGLNRNWPKWLIDNLLKDKSCEDLSTCFLPKTVVSKNEQLKEVKIYRNRSEVVNLIHRGLPFAGMAVENGGIFDHYLVFYAGRQSIKRIDIELLETETIVNNLCYFVIRLKINGDGDLVESELQVDELSEANLIGTIFLPKLLDGQYVQTTNEEDIIEYTAIYSNWKIMESNTSVS